MKQASQNLTCRGGLAKPSTIRRGISFRDAACRRCGNARKRTKSHNILLIKTSLTSSKEKKFGKHPTQKPTKIISHFIKHLSNKNDVVLDPFMGSGTTGVCSRKMNRKFIGIDLDKEYYELSKTRMLNE